MTQVATVEKILKDGYVQISVPRKSACGHDCEECAGCGMTGASIYAEARDPVGVHPGDKVVVESSTRAILGVTWLVYMLSLIHISWAYTTPEQKSPPVMHCMTGGTIHWRQNHMPVITVMTLSLIHI